MSSRRVAIVGPTTVISIEPIVQFVWSLGKGSIVLTTGANGVAQVARDAAKSMGLAVDVVLADWTTGYNARHSRNTELVRLADEIAIWWDGGSEGINVLRATVRAGKSARVFACVTSTEEKRTGT